MRCKLALSNTSHHPTFVPVDVAKTMKGSYPNRLSFICLRSVYRLLYWICCPPYVHPTFATCNYLNVSKNNSILSVP